MKFDVFARTEIGCARERNEDAFLVLDLEHGSSGLVPPTEHRSMRPPGTVVAVCDGMGGAAAGDIASKMAVHELETVMRRRSPLIDVGMVERTMLEAVTSANQRIAQFARQYPDKRGMGTTMTAAAVFGPDVIIVQVGDSRAYIKRAGLLQQLTVDQNVVGQMIASGQIRPEEARHVRQRNVLLEAIGVQERVGPDLIRVRVQPGDVLLLCTDGLTGPLEDQRILSLMMQHDDPIRCCRALTEAACAAGGPDNVTVAAIRIAIDPVMVINPHATVAFERRGALA